MEVTVHKQRAMVNKSSNFNRMAYVHVYTQTSTQYNRGSLSLRNRPYSLVWVPPDFDDWILEQAKTAITMIYTLWFSSALQEVQGLTLTGLLLRSVKYSSLVSPKPREPKSSSLFLSCWNTVCRKLKNKGQQHN